VPSAGLGGILFRCVIFHILPDLLNGFVVIVHSYGLYINRWKVETFFKWIKQHLKIKVFWGESANAVKTQIWVAICTFVLVAMIKERGKIPHSMNNILQILSVCAFDKAPVNQLFSSNDKNIVNDEAHNQLNLFDL
jgi:hypothetical protein